MPWVRIDDHFDEHPKLAAAGPLAWALWFAGLAYCNRNLTDGFIPRNVALRLLDWTHSDGSGEAWQLCVTSPNTGSGFGTGADVDSANVIGVLITAGLWEKTKGGYTIHDYLDYQPSKEEVLAERARWADKKRRARLSNTLSRQDSSGDSPRDSPGESPESPPGKIALSPLESPVESQPPRTRTRKEPSVPSVTEANYAARDLSALTATATPSTIEDGLRSKSTDGRTDGAQAHTEEQEHGRPSPTVSVGDDDPTVQAWLAAKGRT